MNNALKPESLQAQACTARGKLAELEREAQAAEQAAQAAQAASKSAKTLEASSAATLQIQSTTLLAGNLRADAEAFRKANLTLFDQADRELKVDELTSLDDRLKSEFSGHTTRIADLIANVPRELRGALLELAEAVVESNKLRSRARNLAQTLGAPDVYAPVTLDYLVNQIAPVPSSYSGALPVSLRCFTTNGDERARRFVFEVNNLLHGDDQ
jgi:hypothetical protein